MTLQEMRLAWMERALSGLDWLARRRHSTALPAHLVTGSAGEDAAYFHLRRKGYTVVARRWSAGNVLGDLDLIAWHGPSLCFIEVKTRTARDLTPAEAAVDRHKRHTLRRLARAYLRHLPQNTPPPTRFDVISVYLVPGEPRQIEHFQNAFTWSEYESAY